MVVILGDGTIVADDDPRARLRRARTHLPDTRLKLAVAAVALAAAYSFVFAPGSEAANDKCPVPLTVRGTQVLVYFAPLAPSVFCAARQNAVLRRSPLRHT